MSDSQKLYLTLLLILVRSTYKKLSITFKKLKNFKYLKITQKKFKTFIVILYLKNVNLRSNRQKRQVLIRLNFSEIQPKNKPVLHSTFFLLIAVFWELLRIIQRISNVEKPPTM